MRIVELDVRHAFGDRRLHLGGDDRLDVVEDGLAVGVRRLRNAGLVAARRDVRRGGHRDLERRAARVLLEERDLVGRQAVLLLQLRANDLPAGLDACRRRDRCLVAPDQAYGRRARDVTFDRRREVSRPTGAPHLAVADDLDATLLLQRDGVDDRPILDGLHLVVRYLAFTQRSVRIKYFLRA
jgi:hypothetical protein